ASRAGVRTGDRDAVDLRRVDHTGAYGFKGRIVSDLKNLPYVGGIPDDLRPVLAAASSAAHRGVKLAIKTEQDELSGVHVSAADADRIGLGLDERPGWDRLLKLRRLSPEAPPCPIGDRTVKRGNSRVGRPSWWGGTRNPPKDRVLDIPHPIQNV